MQKSSPSAWIEVLSKGPSSGREEAVAALVGAGSPGVVVEDESRAIEDLVSHTDWSGPYPDEPEGEVLLKAYLPSDFKDKEKLAERLRTVGFTFSTRAYQELDWVSKWKKTVKLVRVRAGERAVVIKPTWVKYRKSRGEAIVEMDPGVAFGTGSHATTKMCLRAIIGAISGKKVKSLLDVGTGTGVLAIAAKKLGVNKVRSLEIDTLALKCARKNARLNKVDIRAGAMPLEVVKGSFDVVVANILFRELKRLMPHLIERTSLEGLLILSGLLAKEAVEMKEFCEATGRLRHVKTIKGNEWAGLVFRRSLA